MDGQLLAQSDLEVDDLANEIEQHEYLMQDSVTGEQLRMYVPSILALISSPNKQILL